MTDIHIKRKHNFGKEKCISMAEELGKKIQGALGGEVTRDGDSFRFKTSMASGELRAGEDEIEVSVKLGMLGKALKPKIEAEIEKACDKYLV